MRPLLLGIAGALLPFAAHAAVSLGETPSAWPSAPPTGQARTRADAWARQLGGRVLEVRASPHADDFTETLVLVERDGAMPSEPTAAGVLRTVFEPVLGDENGTLVVPSGLDGSPWVVRGTLPGEPRTLHLGVASDGPRHVAIIFAVLTAEQSLYRDRIDAAFETLQGVRPPLHPLGRTRLLVLATLGFAAGLAAGWSLAARRVEGSAARVGGFVALAGVAVAIAVGLVSWLLLAPYAANLALEGSTPRATAWAIAGVGFACAACVGAIAALWRRAERPVRSAPTAGVFAERKASSGFLQMSGRGIRGQHPDGESTLGDPTEGADLISRPHWPRR